MLCGMTPLKSQRKIRGFATPSLTWCNLPQSCLNVYMPRDIHRFNDESATLRSAQSLVHVGKPFKSGFLRVPDIGTFAKNFQHFEIVGITETCSGFYAVQDKPLRESSSDRG